jgi:hypothetical protein
MRRQRQNQRQGKQGKPAARDGLEVVVLGWLQENRDENSC